jgi:hypothetical protein
MPKKITPYTPLAEAGELSEQALHALRARNLDLVGDFHGQDIAGLLRGLKPPDSRNLFEILVSSGVDFTISPDSELRELGLFSDRTIKKLNGGGYDKLSDFAGAYFPDVYELVGYGIGKTVLLPVVLARVPVRFARPEWSEQEWKGFVAELVNDGLVSWEDIAVAVLAELNPPQVGTAVANAVKHNYPKGQTMREVWRWFYAQSGKCEISGKRLFLEADHKEPKEQFLKSGRDIREADTLANYQLLTKRENVIKRGSHRLGGISFANAAAVLMYVLLRYRPATLGRFERLCRQHGLTMSGIRFQEAWAMAVWLARDGKYDLDPEGSEPIEESAPSDPGEREIAEEVEEVADEVAVEELAPSKP